MKCPEIGVCHTTPSYSANNVSNIVALLAVDQAIANRA